MKRPIPGFSGYSITDNGQVWSAPRLHRTWVKQLKPDVIRGHFRVTLFRGGIRHRIFVHRLVLETFVGPCPSGMETCHNNGDPADNRLENLRWDTNSANKQDAVRHGTAPGFQNRGRINHSKLTETEVRWIRYLRRAGVVISALAEGFGISKQQIRCICKRKCWARI